LHLQFSALCYLQDAASLAIAIMKKRLRSRIFVGCDNEPLSRSLPKFIFFSSLSSRQQCFCCKYLCADNFDAAG